MKVIRLTLAVSAFVVLGAVGAASASAAFGVSSFYGGNVDQLGGSSTQANAHPYANETGFTLNTITDPGPGPLTGTEVPDGGDLKQTSVELPAGMVGNPQATPKCSIPDFLENFVYICPDSTQVGSAKVEFNNGGQHQQWVGPIYNLEPSPGEPALFGFYVFPAPVYLVPEIRSNGDYGLNMVSRNIDETFTLLGVKVTFWGDPASPSHDMERGNLLFGICGNGVGSPPCRSQAPEVAFLTNNPDCTHGPFATKLNLESWTGALAEASFVSQDDEGHPVGVTGCDRVPFDPSIATQPVSDAAGVPTGFDVKMHVPDDGLLQPGAIAQSELKKAVVRLPEGVTVNPSAASGLGTCSLADYAREDVNSEPGSGCPESSRLGSVEIHTPLLEEELSGSIYLAQPDDPSTTTPGAENPFDSLMSIYLVARAPERGVVIKQAGRVELDPKTGQIVTTFENLPQLPFSDLKLHFRSGQRAPLVSPPACGTYATVAELTPWSAEDASDVKFVKSEFKITKGAEGGSCPGAGKGFHPTFLAGSANNAAGSFSPFEMRMTRKDNDQELTRFDAVLPQGILAKLRSVGECPSGAIATAKAKTGQQEIAVPSCPASSEIGQTMAGAGIGSALTYVPGHLYLGGPFHGAPLSAIAITPAVAGPFDVGTVVVRQALRVDPVTAQVTVDGSASDPIPHILKGIELNLRDLRVQIDKPAFTTTPTSCDPTAVGATLFGSGQDPFSSGDDVAAKLSSRYQAASCLNLGFKPKLSLKLSGATHRSAHPKLRAVLKARKGDANIGKAVVTLPRTEFLENAHIRTVCTRVQYAADNCPKGSVYGYAKAWSPLLDKPLQGPVYLRSSNHPLPDLVASLDGQIHIDVAGRIDSVHQRMRASFSSVPDAPVSKFVLTMQGGKKGLLVNSTELCRAKPRASVEFTGHNGKVRNVNPKVGVDCGTRRH